MSPPSGRPFAGAVGVHLRFFDVAVSVIQRTGLTPVHARQLHYLRRTGPMFREAFVALLYPVILDAAARQDG